MSKEIKYYCDLCKEHKNKQDILCLHFSSTKRIGSKFGGYELNRNVDLAHKHICFNCIELIKQAEIV